MASRTETRVEGNKKKTYSYSVDTKGFGYSIIDDESGIRDDFNFLIDEIPNKLDNVIETLQNAAANTSAFEVNEIHDIGEACENIISDINNLKGGLAELYQAFMLDIDNINAELAYNFGWIRIGKVRGVTRTETIKE